MSQEPSATLVVCDDIRTEASGKTFIVGMYGGNIVVPKIPVKLPRLVFLVRLRSNLDDPHHWMAVRIEAPGAEPFVSEKIPTGMPPQVMERTKKTGAVFFDSSHSIPFSPFEIKERGRIKVWALSDKGEHYAGSVEIESMQDVATDSSPEAALMSIAYYAKLRKTLSEDDAQGMAAVVAEFAASMVPSQLLEGHPVDNDMLMEFAPNRFVVFFAHPRDNEPNIVVEGLPEGVSAEVSGASRFGFSVTVSPSDVSLNGLRYTVR